MSTRGALLNVTDGLPLRRLAASSSLPPELKILLNEFGTALWQFGPTEIAAMLSPAAPPPSSLVDAAYSLLGQNSEDWPKDADESSFHEPLVCSLNDFLKASHLALDRSDPPLISKDERWYSDLRFMLLGTGSCGIHGKDSGSVKREAVGGISTQSQVGGPALAIPVKLDEDWPAVVAQAARSARILYAIHSLRKFALVVMFRHTTLELRFLLNHRGGAAVSKALSVVEEEGKKGILRIFLSMLMWRNEEDAGMYSSDVEVNGVAL